ncbi:MAG: FG-GAP-like repeat-containing protein, partial [bacterium]|nr:FG-GAP-like repeat-containing protein [bacterium]
GSMPTAAASADTAIDGETTSNYFGRFLAAGDFNADGRTDLAVGASWYSVRTGRAYIFYNDGSYPASASSADATITGEATDDYFGISLAPGDFNSDGKVDLAVGAQSYADSGRVYIFYNDGSYPTEASSADAIITGESGTSGQFGTCVVAGDFNADGRTDLAVGANLYSTNTGQVYIFYNDGSMPTEAVSADAIIAGEAEGNYFGWVIVAGDFNADGRTDLAVAAQAYATDAGRAYIFYNDGSYSAGASSADITITGQAATNFGTSLTAGDFNADGKTDLAVGAQAYSTNTGRVYIFYTGAAIPVDVTATSLVMTGEAADSKFGSFLSAGDFNADGKTDLAVGANGFDSNAGKFYIYITEAKTYTIQTGTKINGTIKLDQGQVLFK